MARAPLTELKDWELEQDEQNIYGWPVADSVGVIHGTVTELIVDTDQERVVEIVTSTGESFDPHDVDILDNVVALHVTPSVESGGVVTGGATRYETSVDTRSDGADASDAPMSGVGSGGSSHLGASMASASPEEGNALPTEESGPPTIQAGVAAAGGAMGAASRPRRPSPRIQRIAMDHQLPEHSPTDHQLPDAQQPPDHQLGA